MPFSLRSVLSRLLVGLPLLAVLAGCTGLTPYDQLQSVTPTGSAFSRALYTDYAGLARSLGIQNAPAAGSFDANDSFSLSGVNANVADVANAFAKKAIRAANGEEPLPEPTPPDNYDAETGRQKLLRALDTARKASPALAARAQADYDCWVLNATVDSLASSSAQCHKRFLADLTHLGQGPAPAPAPTTKVETKAQSANTVHFTVYFALNSARLDAAAMDVIRQAIDTARKGRQSRITIVGHTDTTGTEALNLTLSQRRAEAVKSAMVQLGARAPAVAESGKGEAGLAVDTPDGVPNPKNRRAVITLIP